jgi:hypothetical protein
MESQMFRDRLNSGLAAMLIGLFFTAFCTACLLLTEPSLDTFGGGQLFLCAGALGGLFSIALGVSWLFRRVSVSPAALQLTDARSSRTIAPKDVERLRFKRNAPVPWAPSNIEVLIVQANDGFTLEIVLHPKPMIRALQPWFDAACDALLMRWQKQLDEGETISVCRGVRLGQNGLERKGVTIDLGRPFSADEVPPSPFSAPLLRVEGHGGRILLDGHADNMRPLKRYLAARQRRFVAPR